MTMDTRWLCAVFYEKFGFKGLARGLWAAMRAARTRRRPRAWRTPAASRTCRGANMGLFDDPAPGDVGGLRPCAAYDTILTWDAFDTWLARVDGR
jgi:DNA polymerase-1